MARRSFGEKVVGRLALHLGDPIRRSVRRRRNAATEYAPLFVAGAMGSGTTLLAFDLGVSFDVAGVVEESALQVSRSSFLRVPPIARHDSIAAYLDRLRPREGWSVPGARAALQEMYRAHATSSGEGIVDKGPNANLMRAEFFWRCFPDAWMIMIFRDPVANIEGFRRKWPLFGHSPLMASVEFYRDIHESFLRVADARQCRNVLVMSYEGLVRSHEESLALVSERTGLERSEVARRLAKRPNVPGQGIRNVDGDRIGLVSDANASAYRNLGAAEIETIRSELGSLHAEMIRRAENEPDAASSSGEGR